MATRVSKWAAENGVLFDTEEEAVQEDLVQSLAELLREASYSYDYDCVAGARAILESYHLTELEPK